MGWSSKEGQISFYIASSLYTQVYPSKYVFAGQIIDTGKDCIWYRGSKGSKNEKDKLKFLSILYTYL